MDQYCKKIRDFLKEFDEMNFFINFYLNNVGHEPEKALVRAMDECLENLGTELMYNYSETLDCRYTRLSQSQESVIDYLKTEPENLYTPDNKKEEKKMIQTSDPIPITHEDNTIHWQNHISCSP